MILPWIVGGAVVVVAIGAVCRRPIRRIIREIEAERARELFHLQRERLEAKFHDLAKMAGKPKGLRWEACEFHSSVSFVRERTTGQLTAFAEVTIRFSAIEGEGMEEVEAVKNLRHASAVFHYHKGQWGTGGRALFNMNPEEAAHHFQDQYEPISVAPELARHD